MMDVREKLVGLLMQVEDNMCDDCGREPVGCAVVAIADHLIANGVEVQTEEEKWNALNEAFDLGVDSVLHDHFGLSWNDAAELREEVKRIQEATKWIPVTERKPDIELVEAKTEDIDLYSCLATIKNDRARSGRYVGKVWYDGIGFIDDDRIDITCNVTHWMPLPQPPKGE